ncbi:MAG: hypothetical protein CVU57_11260 [Deltaproteobacteria bacterium HGW-Deltaproteobacteria-15]|nr:MAG: hypothetical protein CVU57_11260 [Deltaproteobacteria bacterium HGW-Deltaproteobacteria-15]
MGCGAGVTVWASPSQTSANAIRDPGTLTQSNNHAEALRQEEVRAGLPISFEAAAIAPSCFVQY